MDKITDEMKRNIISWFQDDCSINVDVETGTSAGFIEVSVSIKICDEEICKQSTYAYINLE